MTDVDGAVLHGSGSKHRMSSTSVRSERRDLDGRRTMARSVAQKLGVKAGNRVYPINAPAGYAGLLGGLPAGARFVDGPPADVVHLFAESAADLEQYGKAAIDALAP